MPLLCVTLAKQLTLPLLYRHNSICCVQETGVKKLFIFANSSVWECVKLQELTICVYFNKYYKN